MKLLKQNKKEYTCYNENCNGIEYVKLEQSDLRKLSIFNCGKSTNIRFIQCLDTK